MTVADITLVLLVELTLLVADIDYATSALSAILLPIQTHLQ